VKITEVRDMSNNELNVKLKDMKEELFNLRFQAATGQLENPMRIPKVRRDIARIKTIIREREIKSMAKQA
jgi:large subunit ribosomal protein L29